MQNFENKLKNAFMKEKNYLRGENAKVEADVVEYREHVNAVLDRVEEKLTTEVKELKDLFEKEMLENEEEQKELNVKVHADIEEAKQRIKELEEDPMRKLLRGLPWWADWSSWSGCYQNCTGNNSGRIQSRTRTAVLMGEQTGSQATQSETETRPCNAVQFAGCLKTYGTADNYGVTYDFADQLAQATCTAMSSGGYINAVRRQCSNSAPTCATICKQVGRHCFNQLHVYRGSPVLGRNAVSQKGLQMYKYNSCSGQFCGPNFCCCRS